MRDMVADLCAVPGEWMPTQVLETLVTARTRAGDWCKNCLRCIHGMCEQHRKMYPLRGISRVDTGYWKP